LVGLCAERGIELVVGILAILKAGGAYVPLDPSYPQERLSFMLEDSATNVLLTQRRLLDSLPHFTGLLICFDEVEGRHDYPDSDPPPAATPENLAYVIYTSGSTGRPKGSLVTHANVARLFAATEEWFSFTGDDVWTMFHSPSFDFSVWELWGALLHGGRLVVVPYMVSRSPEAFLKLLRREGVTVLNQTPSAFRQLMRAEQEAAEAGEYLNLRAVIFGGEALEVQSLRPWVERHGDEWPRLVNMYGITETTVHVTYRPLAARDCIVGAGSMIGRAIPDLSVFVLDERQNLLPVGVQGELYVGGAGLARGYLGRAGLTAERFVPDPFADKEGARLYRTGDLGRYLSGGDIEYLGRIDKQVKIRGFRIEPGEVEAALRSHAFVRDCVVMARAETSGEGLRLVAYVVPADGAGEAYVGELRAHLQGRLPEYMIPSAFVVVVELPLTAHGKIDYARLPEPEGARPELGREYVRPRTAVEEVVAGIWSRVLAVEDVGVEDNFFELGGHSLLAMQVRSRVSEAFNFELPLRAIYEEPTVAGLARRIEQESVEASPSLPSIRPAGRTEPLPLSFAQERLWFLDRLVPEDAFYNIVFAVRLDGRLDVSALERALSEIMRRHEVLRTSFVEVDGRPVQVINAVPELSLQVEDLRHTASAEREPESRRRIAEEGRCPFNLSAGPLLRARLLRMEDDEHIAVLTMHHIVSDGWSMGVLVREVAALYTSYSRGEESPLSELEVQYADYAVWQRGQLQGEALERELAYWRKQLEGAPAVLELPTDRPRPAVQSFRGGRRQFTLGEGVSGRVSEVARGEGVTQFMLL
ncbi:MAG: amino acid adenylation domain-containing protein, partial [Pyrinomonadaceae bacterium]